MLSHQQAKTFYDAFGSKQDKQFYENLALEKLIELSDFKNARSIFEFGCGTGKLASRLLDNILPENARYQGVDISSTMIELCTKRTKNYRDRVNFKVSKGDLVFDIEDKSIDRFISTYVLDLLAEDDINTVINEAYRMLAVDGYLCLAGLTHGVTVASRMVEKIWQTVFNIKPSLVGGCRPVTVARFIDESSWKWIYRDTIVSYGISSEVIMAQKR